MFSIRGCTGLGDSFYNYSVAKYYRDKGKIVIVETQFPEVYERLGIKTTSQRLHETDINCTYVPFKLDRMTNQFEDVLKAARITEKIDLSVEIKPHNSSQLKSMAEIYRDKGNDKPVCVIADLYMSSGIRAKEKLIPNKKIYQSIVDELSNHFYTILVGIDGPQIQNCHYDATRKTSLKDLMELVKNSKFVLTQVGALLPMAEAFGVKVFSVLAKGYALSGDTFLSTITPTKVVCSKYSECHYDDKPELPFRALEHAGIQ